MKIGIATMIGFAVAFIPGKMEGVAEHMSKATMQDRNHSPRTTCYTYNTTGNGQRICYQMSFPT